MSQLVYFVWYNLHDILHAAIQSSADLQEYLSCDMAIPSHLCNGRRADAGLCVKVLFLHILIDE